MLKIAVLFCTFLFCCLAVKAQLQPEIQSGLVILRGGEDTLKGNITLHLPDNLIELTEGSTIRTYSARQVDEFVLYSEEGSFRHFFSVPFSEYSGYRTPWFFEQIYVGPLLSLYVRESTTMVMVPVFDSFSQRNVMSQRPRQVLDFYFLPANGAMKHYKNRRKDLYALMPEHEQEIKSFIKDSDISYVDREDLLRITQYMNSLTQAKPTENDKK